MWLGCFFAFSQQLTPPIHNYSSVDYTAASQNWGIDIDEKGIIYTANNQGLLSYDGQTWELYPLDNGSIIRSVYTKGDRIYTGSYQEFGYWQRDKTGKLEYTSLMPLFGEYSLQNDEFWEIMSFKGAIYFRSFGAIYRYKNDTIKPIKNLVTNKMAVYRDKLLVSAGRSGLYFLNDNGATKKLPNQDLIAGEQVIDLAVSGDKLLIGTRDALYTYENDKVVLFADKKLNEDISRFELNHLMFLGEDELVLGTVKNGIIHYNQSAGKYTIYNRNSGLQNNTVLGMAKRNGSIWLGLDNGIDQIKLNSFIKLYTDDTGELGAVYDMLFFKDKLYLASNTGVYTFTDNNLTLINGAGGHAWNLEILEGRLYANHNTGTFLIENDIFKAIEDRTGSFEIINAPDNKNIQLIGNYTGISKIDEEGNLEVIDSINFPVRQMVFTNKSQLWAAHPYEGIYHITLNDSLTRALKISKLHKVNGKDHYNANIYQINHQLAILNDGRWYRYNIFKDSLEAFNELNKYNKHKLLFQDNKDYWFTNIDESSLLYTDFKGNDIKLSSDKINSRMVKNYEKITSTNDSTFYLTLNDGFAQLNLNKMIRRQGEINVIPPLITAFTDRDTRYELDKSPEVPYAAARDINIHTALPVSDATGIRYELIGTDTVSGVVTHGNLNFQNLEHGAYELKLFAISPQNENWASTNFNFVVAPPWYLSNLMKFIYVLLFLVLIMVFYWFNRLKLRKQQYLLEQKFEQEHEDRLNQLEKERLLNEITLKRKELANTTMVAAKKNEVLMEIQNELHKDKDKFSNQFRFKHIMTKINKAIKNKDEWQVFETNFNELHEDFFKDVLEAYPQLSSKDLKLCSYLKMNLTSKEIAPLMGISVRGVEVHRYRLRKKMNLHKNENLTNFLIKNF